MNIKINQDDNQHEIDIVINCAREDETVQSIVSSLHNIHFKIPCTNDGEIHQLDISSILYIESVDRKTFLYTVTEVYETDKRLYELEDYLKNLTFFRISKSTIFNLKQVRSLRPELGARLIATMENGERIIISRQYSATIKNALGV